MKNKTCGECKYFSKYENKCCLLVGRGVTYADSDGCMSFVQKLPKVITNGDVIRQGGNRAIAKFAYKTARTQICGVCSFSTIEKGSYKCTAQEGQSCVDGIEAWLNAPAESEGKE
jgi:hypothetical protein